MKDGNVLDLKRSRKQLLLEPKTSQSVKLTSLRIQRLYSQAKNEREKYLLENTANNFSKGVQNFLVKGWG